MPCFNPSWMTWWGSSTSSQVSWDDTDLSRMNPAASLPSPFPLTPFSLPSFSRRDTRWLAGTSGVSSPVVILVYLFPCPMCKPKACYEHLNTSVFASTPITVAKDSENRGFGVTPTEPGPVRHLASPVILMGKLITLSCASLTVLGRVLQSQCALAASLRVLCFSTPELFQAALHGFPSKGL